MSNPLSVRRVIIQTINKDGKPDGKPTFGVIASDDHETSFNDTFFNLDSLNQAINKAGDLLTVADNGGKFETVDRSRLGVDRNFYGKETDYEFNDNCTVCGRNDLPLHTDYMCLHCSPKGT